MSEQWNYVALGLDTLGLCDWSTVILLFSVWGCEAIGVKENGQKTSGLLRVMMTDTVCRGGLKDRGHKISQ